jgi:hypothetical protein
LKNPAHPEIHRILGRLFIVLVFLSAFFVGLTFGLTLFTGRRPLAP